MQNVRPYAGLTYVWSLALLLTFTFLFAVYIPLGYFHLRVTITIIEHISARYRCTIHRLRIRRTGVASGKPMANTVVYRLLVFTALARCTGYSHSRYSPTSSYALDSAWTRRADRSEAFEQTVRMLYRHMALNG